MKNLEKHNSRFEQAEKMISKFEDKVIEIIQSEEQKQKRIQKNEQRDLWGTMKCNNIHITGIPEEKAKKRDKKMKK